VSHGLSHHGFAACQTGVVSSGVDRDEYIAQLRAQGYSAMEIADVVGLSRSQVHRILAVVGDAFRGDVDDEDDDEDDSDDPLGAIEDADDLVLLYPSEPAPEELVESFTYVGEEQGFPRYMDSAGHHFGALGWYRWKCFVGVELDDRDRADRVAADMTAQVGAYGRRHGLRAT
jgi:Helix-turn-helix domain of resolvase